MPETNESPAPADSGRVPQDHVVVGVDGSPVSLRALDRAADEAGRRGVGLMVLCGAAPPRYAAVPVTDTDRERARRAGLEVAESAAQRARDRVPGLTVVPSGSYELAADALVRASRTAALTVVGSRGRGGFRGLLIGSVGLRLAAHSVSPLLVVRGDESADEEGRDTVVGLKRSGATAPLRYGFEQAVRDGSPLRVVHTWGHPGLPGLQRRSAKESPEGKAAEAFVRDTTDRIGADYDGVSATGEARHGSPAEQLIDLSEGARTVVLGARREQRRLSLQVSPVVNAVLQHARCPVALVPVV